MATIIFSPITGLLKLFGISMPSVGGTDFFDPTVPFAKSKDYSMSALSSCICCIFIMNMGYSKLKWVPIGPVKLTGYACGLLSLLSTIAVSVDSIHRAQKMLSPSDQKK